MENSLVENSCFSFHSMDLYYKHWCGVIRQNGIIWNYIYIYYIYLIFTHELHGDFPVRSVNIDQRVSLGIWPLSVWYATGFLKGDLLISTNIMWWQYAKGNPLEIKYFKHMRVIPGYRSSVCRFIVSMNYNDDWWLIDGLIDWLIDWLIGWLIDWLTGWLVD